MALFADAPVLGTSLPPVQGNGYVPLATCWDALYWDLVNSRSSAADCVNASAAAGYDIVGASNASAKFAIGYGGATAVFFVAGHSLDFSEGTAKVGQAMLFESPDNNGDIDAISGSSLYTTANQAITMGQYICNTASPPQCHQTMIFADYPFADTPFIFQMNLAVFAGCYTSQEGATLHSINYVASASGADNSVGFTGEVFHPNGATDQPSAYGNAWAQTFWSDLKSNLTYGQALVDGSNAVANLYAGNAYGWNTYVWYQSPGAASTLYPAQFGRLKA